VLQAFPVTEATVEDHPDDMDYKLHMMDFSPLAVERRQGLGKVVTEPSSIKTTESAETLTTSLPYVEVVSDRIFGADQVTDIWVDKDRIYLPKLSSEESDSVSFCVSNEVRHTDSYPGWYRGARGHRDLERGLYILAPEGLVMKVISQDHRGTLSSITWIHLLEVPTFIQVVTDGSGEMWGELNQHESISGTDPCGEGSICCHIHYFVVSGFRQ
jgi:hypothetical protein